MKEKKILIIRSATRILNQTINSLKQEFPQSQIAVVAPAHAREALLQDPSINEVFPVPENRRLTLFNIGLKNIRHLRDQHFDLGVSLYNVDHGMGYSNIDCLVWASGATEMRGYNVSGKYSVLTPDKIIKTWFLEKTSLLWVALNYITTTILFTLITITLCSEWCVRKILARPIKEKRHEVTV